MDEPTRLLQLKRDYLVPCVYHFYREPPAIVRGEGVYLYDSTGKQYLDCFSGVTVMNLGHSHPVILEAAMEQLRTLQHTTTIYLTAPMLELAEAISKYTQPGLRKFFFCASGSEANEGALMAAALATGRSECIYFREGLHGRTKWAMNVTGLDMWRTDPNPMQTAHAVPGPRHPESLAKIEELLRHETIAAVIAEPIQGNGGIVVPPKHYWQELRAICSRYGTLLIADEIQTAWNRTGNWFATQHWGVTPDIVTVAKALGNGFPIAAYITSDAIAAKYSRPGAATFGGNLVACHVAKAVLDYHEKHHLGIVSQRLGSRLLAQLQELQSRHPCITEVRGMGLMIGMELRDLDGVPASQRTDWIMEEMKALGFLLGKTGPGRNVLTFLPPLIIAEADLDRLVEVLDSVLGMPLK